MTDWPRNFVYVCSVGQGAVVNALPLVHAGLDRVAKVVVFCGASDPHTLDTTELNQAIKPMEQLTQIIHQWRPDLPVERRYGDPDSMADWHQRMEEFARQATPDRPVVFNLTGGRKQMSLGAFAAMLGAPANAGRLIFVSGRPLHVDFVDVATLESSPAPAHEELTLPQYLSFYGIREIEPEAREWVVQSHRERAAVVGQFAKAIMPQAKVLQAIIDKAAKVRVPSGDNSFTPGLIDPWTTGRGKGGERAAAAAAMRLLAGHAGLTKAKNDSGQPIVHAETIDGVKLLRGGWMETLLYNRLSRYFKGRNDVSLVPNVKVSLGEGADEIGEFDIAVMIRSQLHIVEAKVAHFAEQDRGGSAKALAQIDKWKGMMLGQFGRVIVVQPRQTVEELELARSSFLARARKSGADLALGPRAIETTIELLDKLSRQ
jgi:hypothetical protein